MTSIADVHQAPATSASTEAYVTSPPVSIPGSAPIPSVSMQLASTSSSAPEYPSAVSSRLALANCRD